MAHPAAGHVARAALFNGVVYAASALLYSVTLFALEAARSGTYVFLPGSKWRNVFNYLAVCSWPVLFFGALMLLAVRVAAGRARKRRSQQREDDPSRVRQLRPRGWLAVSRSQRLVTAFGFLWVAAGLVLTAVAAVYIFIGQRDRFRRIAFEEGRPAGVKSYIMPALSGAIPAVLYILMALSMIVRFVSTASGRDNAMLAKKTVPAENPDEVVLADQYQFPLPAARSSDLHIPPNPVQSPQLAFAPVAVEQRVVQQKLQQLKDMGFSNPHQNLAALQAASFDMHVATQKLSNAQSAQP